MDYHQNRIIEGVLLKSRKIGKVIKTLVSRNRFMVVVKDSTSFRVIHHGLSHICGDCVAYSPKDWAKEAVISAPLKTIKDAFDFIRRFS